MAERTRVRLTAAEYFALPAYQDHDLIQLIDGEVIIDMPPVPRHQLIVVELVFLFKTMAREAGDTVLTSPDEVYLDEHNVYEPDVLYLKPDSSCQITEKRLIGAPDLVVEVLSPSTAKRDRAEKFRGYARHRVAEYWIVDPFHDVIEVWLHNGTTFARIDAYGRDDTFRSQTLAVDVVVAALLPVLPTTG